MSFLRMQRYEKDVNYANFPRRLFEQKRTEVCPPVRVNTIVDYSVLLVRQRPGIIG